MCWLHSSTLGLVCQYPSQHNNLRECITSAGSMGTHGQPTGSRDATSRQPRRPGLSTRRVCLRLRFAGSWLPATSSPATGRLPVTGCGLTGNRPDPGLRPRAHRWPPETEDGDRRQRPGPATGSTSGHGLGHRVPASGGDRPQTRRPGDRDCRPTADRIPRYHLRPPDMHYPACAPEAESQKPRFPMSPPGASLGKHEGMARFLLAVCALYGNVLGRESVICWH